MRDSAARLATPQTVLPDLQTRATVTGEERSTFEVFRVDYGDLTSLCLAATHRTLIERDAVQSSSPHPSLEGRLRDATDEKAQRSVRPAGVPTAAEHEEVTRGADCQIRKRQ